MKKNRTTVKIHIKIRPCLNMCAYSFFSFQEKPPPKPLWVIPLEIALNRYYYHDDFPIVFALFMFKFTMRSFIKFISPKCTCS